MWYGPISTPTLCNRALVHSSCLCRSFNDYGLEDGYVRIELDDGSVLVVAASWQGAHVYVDMGPSDRTVAAGERVKAK